MEIIANLANFVTVLTALGLKYQVSFLTEQRANIILLVANIFAIVAFIIAIAIVPCRTYRQRKRAAKAEKERSERVRHAQEKVLAERAHRKAEAEAKAAKLILQRQASSPKDENAVVAAAAAVESANVALKDEKPVSIHIHSPVSPARSRSHSREGKGGEIEMVERPISVIITPEY